MIIAILIAMKWNLKIALIFTSLITKDIEHFLEQLIDYLCSFLNIFFSVHFSQIDWFRGFNPQSQVPLVLDLMRQTTLARKHMVGCSYYVLHSFLGKKRETRLLLL